ncbi:hypothetical protein QZH41_010710, partial [Actinostola sp. cb2023]
MKTFLALLLVLSLVSLGQGMKYGRGVFLVSSPSDFLCKTFSFGQIFTSQPRVQLSLHMNEPKAYTYEAAKFTSVPYVYVTPVHSVVRNKRDAASVWAEDVTVSGFSICLRELKNFDGVHTSITVNWLALEAIPAGWAIGVESAVKLQNTEPLTSATHYSFCKVVPFPNTFYNTPVMITTARHFLDKTKPNAVSSKNNAITEWVEKVSTTQFTVCMKDIQPYSGHHDPVTISYMAIGHLDPCLNVKCTHYAKCKAYGPQDARCECPKSCPPYEDFKCGSDGKTYTNLCFYQKYICETHKNVTIVHSGACYPFVLHHGRVTLDLSKSEVQCQVVVYKTQNFAKGPTVHVQVSVNYYKSPVASFVHDAAVAWAEKISVNNFTVCALKAGRNDRATPDKGITYVDYMAYQGSPAGAVAGEITLTNWWQGTTCQIVDLPNGKFSKAPQALVSSEHIVEGQSHDAATIWLEDISTSKFKVCLREMQNFDGLHKDIHVNWIAYLGLPAKMNAEKFTLTFSNTYLPLVKDNFAYCQNVALTRKYTAAPTLIATARHASEIGKLLPVYNSISVWIE